MCGFHSNPFMMDPMILISVFFFGQRFESLGKAIVPAFYIDFIEFFNLS